MPDYSLVNTLIAFVVIVLIGVGLPVYALWKDNRKPPNG